MHYAVESTCDGSGIFFREGLDDPNQIESVQEISLCAHGVFVQQQGPGSVAEGLRGSGSAGGSSGMPSGRKSRAPSSSRGGGFIGSRITLPPSLLNSRPSLGATCKDFLQVRGSGQVPTGKPLGSSAVPLLSKTVKLETNE